MQNNAIDQDAPSLSAELKHFDELLHSHLAGYQETSAERRTILDDWARSLEAAKQRFWQLNEEHGQAPHDDPEMNRLMQEVRTNVTRLDTVHQNGGPPLA